MKQFSIFQGFFHKLFILNEAKIHIISKTNYVYFVL
nr:MAG TPA: hypothetical protein [Caudoviricetes sp.]